MRVEFDKRARSYSDPIILWPHEFSLVGIRHGVARYDLAQPWRNLARDFQYSLIVIEGRGEMRVLVAELIDVLQQVFGYQSVLSFDSRELTRDLDDWLCDIQTDDSNDIFDLHDNITGKITLIFPKMVQAVKFQIECM